MSESATAITNLLYRYGACVDSGDFEGIGRLFAHARLVTDANADGIEGADTITELYHKTTRIYAETGTPRTKHVFSNPIVEVDESAGRATCNAYFTVLQQTDALPLQTIIAGRYEDSFEHVDGAWRYASKTIIVDLVGDLSQHLLIDFEATQANA